MKSSTTIKLAIAAVIAILFSGFILRAAMKLAATAMHSLIGLVVILLLFGWVLLKPRSGKM